MEEIFQARLQIQLMKAKLLVSFKILRNFRLGCEPILNISAMVFLLTPL